MATPRLCLSHTVSSDAYMAIIQDPAGAPPAETVVFTVPEGRYWTDPLYGLSLDDTTDSACLLGRICQAITDDVAADGAATDYVYLKGYDVDDAINGQYQAAFGTVANTPTLQWSMGNAGANAEGRKIARRLGIDQRAADPTTAATSILSRMVGGIWEPGRNESGDIDNMHTVNAYAFRAADGTAYTSVLGDSLADRVLVLRGLSQAYSRTRLGFPDANLTGAKRDRSFEGVMWPWFAAGEYLRYYADSSATYSWVTSAIAASDYQIPVVDGTEWAVGDVAWLQGENMLVRSIASNTLNCIRDNPRAHAKYSPIGKNAYVGTFVLAMDGGNVTLAEFRVGRKSYDDDRFDFEIPLMQVFL